MKDRLIYALIDPVSEHIRYIGLSTRGLKRPQLHQRAPLKSDKTHKANWIRSLQSAGLSPVIKVIEYCNTDKELSEAENGWIALLKATGCPLTNHKSGGFNGKPDDSTKRKISNKLKGIKRSTEVRQKMSEVKQGAKNPMFGKPVSKQTRLKRAQSMTGTKNHRYGMLPPNGEATRFKPGYNKQT